MPNTRAVIVRNRGSAIFRMIFGLFFIGLGIYHHYEEGAGPNAGLFTMGIGLLFFVYGAYAFFAGNSVVIQTPTAAAAAPDPTARLAQILQMKNDGLISETEYEAKRQEILRSL